MTNEEKVAILKRQIEILKEQNERLHAIDGFDKDAAHQIRRNAETIFNLTLNLIS